MCVCVWRGQDVVLEKRHRGYDARGDERAGPYLTTLEVRGYAWQVVGFAWRRKATEVEEMEVMEVMVEMVRKRKERRCRECGDRRG